MKGVHIGPDFLGRLLITIFIIGLIVVMIATWIPEFVSSSCATKQSERIGGVVSEAMSASAHTIKDFTVDSCMESIDFSPDLYCGFPNQGRFSDTGVTRCYELVQDGQNSGNCVDSTTYVASHGDIYAVYVYEKAPKRVGAPCEDEASCMEYYRGRGYAEGDIKGENSELKLDCSGGKCEVDGDEFEFKNVGCGGHKGTIRKLPTGPSVLDIDTSQFSSSKLKEGRYSAEIGPYSIKFLAAQSSTE